MKRISLALFILIAFTINLSAQSSTGTLSGNVYGPDGLLPGATVTVKDDLTGIEFSTVTNGSGGFEFKQLNAGTYSVRVSLEGFKTYVATSLKIDANQPYTLNPKLELGDIAAEVTVEAGAEIINSSDAELTSTISQEQINQLPLNGRNPLSLLNLTAGANPTTNSVNGQRSSSQDIRRDGLNVQDNFIRTGAYVSDVPTVDDTAEFSVTTQNASVDQGGGSTQIGLVTPRGGDQYHGTAYIYNRNSYFTANTFFNNANGVDKPFLNRNQFGGTASGPLPFPNFGEGGPMFRSDKSFFFFNYEGFRLAQQVSATGTTLLPAARDGSFTYTRNNGTQTTINVLTGQGLASPITGAQGGILSVDPVIQARILNNLPSAGNGILTGTNFLQVLNFNQSNPETRNAFTGRVDYQINDKNLLEFVFRRNKNSDARTDIGSGFSTVPYVNQGGPTTFFTGAYRLILSNNLTNEFRAGFQLSEPFFNESHVASDYLLSIPLVTNPEGSFRSQGRKTDYRNFQDNAVYTWGNHSIRFGGEFESYKVTSENYAGITTGYSIMGSGGNNNILSLQQTQFTGGISSTDLARANALRYLLAGIVGGASRTANLTSPEEGFAYSPSTKHLNYSIYAGYVADQWRARPNLSINAGVRYEYWTPVEAPDRLYLEPVFPDPKDVKSGILNPDGELDIIGTDSGNPTTFTRPDKNNFAPSVGIAYSPVFEHGFMSKIFRPGSTIRGGFRINYVNDEYVKSVSTLVGANPGLNAVTIGSEFNNVLVASITPRTGFSSLPDITAVPTLREFPISFAENNANLGYGSQVFGVDPYLQVQKTYEYNVGIQFALPYKSVLEVRYVGNKSNDLLRTTTFNQLDLRDNQFLEGFKIARENCRIQGATINPTAYDPTFYCTRADNIGLPGQQANPIFDQLAYGGILRQSLSASIFNTVRAYLSQERAGSLAQYYLLNGWNGNVDLVKNPNIFVDEILMNGGKYNYNALQAEFRRRFSNGLSFQANYTFQKILSNVPDDGQNRQGEVQDNNNPDYDYGRPDYDRTHTFNGNFIYDLPFGRGKKFLNQGGIVDAIFGGFQFTTIVNISSGPPLSVLDPRSTSTITFQSDRQRAMSILTTGEIKDLFGEFNTPNGIYAVNPSVLYATASNGVTTQRVDLNDPLPAGYTLVSVRATSPIDQAPFDGQVFFFNKAGEVGNLPQNFLNGLPYMNWDLGLSKSFKFAEGKYKVELRGEVFNVLNKQLPYWGADLDINSNNFGRVTSSYVDPRIMQFAARFSF
ncbi:MAG: carboxypeptidase regulatory-like domain-containing protein [Pyrinomonadaceae bacterium]